MRTIKSTSVQLIGQPDLEARVDLSWIFKACSGRFAVDMETE
jgi:hypothetical protein